jgi:hypothetical protein
MIISMYMFTLKLFNEGRYNIIKEGEGISWWQLYGSWINS